MGNKPLTQKRIGKEILKMIEAESDEMIRRLDLFTPGLKWKRMQALGHIPQNYLGAVSNDDPSLLTLGYEDHCIALYWIERENGWHVRFNHRVFTKEIFETPEAAILAALKSMTEFLKAAGEADAELH